MVQSSIPCIVLKVISGASNNYNRMYHELLRVAGKSLDYDTGSSISFKNFKNLYPIFAFDLSHEDDEISVSSTKEIVFEADVTHGGLNFFCYALVVSDHVANLNVVNQQMQVTVL
eukprot:Lithocolla_globosa_v1_NODE_2125_length_2154_cov_87.383516.p3 type:complete len:115 gc:universal NODE_2125_length_2154_cov_87.383516:635-291(-)